MSTSATLWRMVFAATALSAASSGFAQYSFTKIVDHSSAIPDGSGSFTALYGAFAGEGMVGFYGGGDGQQGAYLWDGAGLTRIADKTTNSPGTSSPFTQFNLSNGAILDGRAYIYAIHDLGASGNATGIYGFDPSGGGTLSTITRRGQAFPSGGGTVNSVTNVYGGGGRLHFGYTRSSNFNNGVFSYDGATLQTTIPEVDFSDSRSEGISAGPTSTDGAAFVIRSSSTISYYDGATFTDIALEGQQIPGQAINFPGFGNYTAPRLTGDDVYFTLNHSGTFGIYHVGVDGEDLSLVANTSTFAPNGHTFSFFGELTADNDRLVFYARTSDNGFGLYSYEDGAIALIIDEAFDPFDGRTVGTIALGDEGLNGDDLAFRVNFTNGTQAIYYTNLAAIPEPASWGVMLGAVAVGTLCRRRRRAAV